MWSVAMVMEHMTFLVRLKTAEGELAKVMAQLQEKQKALSDIEAKVMADVC